MHSINIAINQRESNKMLLKELLQLNESRKTINEAQKTMKDGIPFYDYTPDEKVQISAGKAGWKYNNPRAAARDDDYSIYAQPWYAVRNVSGDKNSFDNFAEALKLAKERKASGVDVAIYVVKQGAKAKEDFRVVAHKDAKYPQHEIDADEKDKADLHARARDIEAAEKKQAKLTAASLKSDPDAIDDASFQEFVESNVKDSNLNHGVFYSPHEAMRMNADWEDSAKMKKFVKDVVMNPKEYCVIRTYTASNADDHWDDIVIAKKQGLKSIYKGLNNQMSREPAMVKEIVAGINDAFTKQHITSKMTPAKYMKLAHGPYSMVEKSGGGSLIYSMKND